MTRQNALRATIVAGLVLGIGCTSIVYTTGPRCPEWSEESVAQLAQMMAYAEAERIELDALEEAIGRQELYCEAMEPADRLEVCEGSSLACWWRGLWR